MAYSFNVLLVVCNIHICKVKKEDSNHTEHYRDKITLDAKYKLEGRLSTIAQLENIANVGKTYTVVESQWNEL